MRIVGGARKGRALIAPADQRIRPTGDRVREALFNRLEHAGLGPGGASAVRGALVLDAFCGTGALGLEALSRGAAKAVFMDSDRQSLDLARRNADALGFLDRATFLLADCTAPPPAVFAAGLAFLDPPYRDSVWPAALAGLAAGGWLAEGCTITVEMDRRDMQPAPGGFVKIDDRTYGKARLVQFTYALS